MIRRVTLVRTDFSMERTTSITMVTRIRALWIILAVTSNRSTVSYETSVLTRATRLNIPESSILHSHHYESFKSYIS
jgi:hypothetical protein